MGISIGLVGLGLFGREFAELYKRHPLVSRIALCDREPERISAFASKPSWKDKFHPRDAYDSFDAICRSDLDALVIITQPWLHAPQAVQGLESGKHVYSAVPILCVPDGDEILQWCDKLVNTVRRTGQHYMLGETTFYHPAAMFCRRKAASGEFGKFIYCEGEYLHGYDHPHCDLRDVRRARANSKAGREWDQLLIEKYVNRGIKFGPMHYPTHSTSGPISVTGAHATRVCCWGMKPHTDDPFFTHENFSNETALFTMSDGSTMRICEHREASAARETFRIYGTEGSFENNLWITKTRTTPVTVSEMRDPLPPEVAEAWKDELSGQTYYGGHEGSHAYLVNEFVSAVAANRLPAVNIYQAVRFMAPGVMAHKSALKDGEILPVPDWGDPPR